MQYADETEMLEIEIDVELDLEDALTAIAGLEQHILELKEMVAANHRRAGNTALIVAKQVTRMREMNV